MRDFVKHLDKRWGERSVVWLLVFAFLILVCISGAFFIRDERRNSGGSDSFYAFNAAPMGGGKINGGAMRTMTMSGSTSGRMMNRGDAAYFVSPEVSHTGSIEMEVADLQSASNSIAEIAKKSSGYIESSSVQGGRGEASVITLRVPQERFDAVMQQIEGQAEKITKVTTGNRDVSSAISNEGATLTSLQSLETGYEKLLADAKDTNEAVTLTNQLAQIRANIQSVQAKINYLISQDSLASITVSLSSEAVYGAYGLSFLLVELSFILLVLAILLKALKHIGKRK